MIPAYIPFPKRLEVSRRWLEAKAAKRIACGADKSFAKAAHTAHPA
jgi:hypothetical protein